MNQTIQHADQQAESVYKIFRAGEWKDATAKGEFGGSADDRRDGFIHLSAAHQLAGTLGRHFAGERGLVLAAFPAARLEPALRWEPSRGGALFPHLHGVLPMAAATGHWLLVVGADGLHQLPALPHENPAGA
jgi:uncharacterized protein (DUF952 family)